MNQPHTPPRRATPTARRLAAACTALAVAVALSACAATTGGTPGSAAPTADQVGTFPVTVTTGEADGGKTVTVAQEPDAIVSLSPTATETLFAVGAGDQVVAVDDNSDFPAEAPRTDLSGFTPNVEAILAHSPDLVVVAAEDADLIASLDRASVPTLVVPAVKDLDGAYEQIERIGTATGHAQDASALVTQMKADIAAAVGKAPQASGLRYFHELDPTLFTVTGDTFIGHVYGLFGMESIADASGDPYPQLSPEFVVAADPDLIFLADAQCCGVSLEQVGARPGWAQLTAVRTGQVHVQDEDIASRWGPRVVDFVETVSTQVATVEREAG
ncbi:MAG: ABC transporter substrate-binding protein [Actinomycetes bacterium]